jgi:ATP-dependent DNA helicase RecG
VREAVVNALLHRDYSPVTRGTQVQVDLYPDRLVVRSPGGLYGGVTVDELGEDGVSSSRNSVLASLLSDTYLPSSSDLVAENRSSGIPAMLDLARRHGLPRPSFTSSVASFVVTMNRSELLSPDVRSWFGDLSVPPATPAHEMALAMLRIGPITNAMLRQWGVDRIAAGQVLRDLVESGQAIKEGGRRYARYVLDPALLAPPLTIARAPIDSFAPRITVERALRSAGVATRTELVAVTGLARSTVVDHLNVLLDQGLVAAEGASRSPKRRYRWVGPLKGDARHSRIE